MKPWILPILVLTLPLGLRAQEKLWAPPPTKPNPVEELDSTRHILVDPGSLPEPPVPARFGEPVQPGLTQFLPGGEVWALAFSPDSRSLAIAGEVPGIRVFALEDGNEDHFLEAHPDKVVRLAYDSTGTLLVSGSSHEVRIWDAITGDLVETLTLEDELRDLAISPDGAWLSVATSGGLSSYFLPRPGILSEVPGLGGVRALLYTPDGTQMVASLDEGRRIWVDTEQSKVVSNQATLLHWTFQLAWIGSPRQLLIAGDSPEVRLAALDPEAKPQVFGGHEGWVRALAAIPGRGFFATGDAEGQVRIFDPRKSEPVALYQDHEEEVTVLAVSPDGKLLASGSVDQVVFLRELSSSGW